MPNPSSERGEPQPEDGSGLGLSPGRWVAITLGLLAIVFLRDLWRSTAAVGPIADSEFLMQRGIGTAMAVAGETAAAAAAK